jgi:hypothetical protein
MALQRLSEWTSLHAVEFEPRFQPALHQQKLLLTQLPGSALAKSMLWWPVVVNLEFTRYLLLHLPLCTRFQEETIIRQQPLAHTT